MANAKHCPYFRMILYSRFLLELQRHFSYNVKALSYKISSLPCKCGRYVHAEYFFIGKVTYERGVHARREAGSLKRS